MMRKKIVWFSTALLLAAQLLTGCIGIRTARESEAPETVQPEAVTETVQTEEHPEPDIPEPVRMLKVAGSQNWHWDYRENGSAEVYSPVLFLAEDGSVYPELADLLKKTGEHMEMEAEKQFVELKKSLDELPPMALYSRTEAAVERADSNYLSVLFVQDCYLGGAHPSRVYSCLNVESRTGKILKLSDFCSSTEALLFRLGIALQNRYPDSLFGNLNAELAQEEKDGSLIWTVGYNGITFRFPGGTLAPYASGDLTVFLSLKENADLLKESDYVAPDAWAAALCADQEFFVDPDGSGVPAVLQAGGTVYDSEGQYFEGAYVSLNGSGSSREAFFYSIRPYLVHTATGEERVYLELTSDNDYRSILVFQIDRGKVLGGSEEMYFGLTGTDGPGDTYGKMLTFDPEQFQLTTRLDALSTYDGVKTYHVGPSGTPETEDALYQIEYGPTLIAVREIPVTDEDGNEMVLKPGEGITLQKTDGSSVVVGETAEGKRVFHGAFSEWPQMIGELEAEECFEEMFFAG